MLIYNLWLIINYTIFVTRTKDENKLGTFLFIEIVYFIEELSKYFL